MATETDTQTASATSKRAQLNKEKRADQNRTRVPEGQMTGGSANLAFDNDMSSDRSKDGDESKGKKNDSKKSGAVNNEEGSDGAMNFRQVMAKEKKEQEKKEEKKEEKSDTYQGSKTALAMSWRALIPSWFISIFIIDVFAFLHVVFSKFFCALGEEWGSPITAVAGGKKRPNIKGMIMKVVEPWLVVLINLFVLLAIFIAIVFLMIGIAITNPWILGWASFSMLWDLIKIAF